MHSIYILTFIFTYSCWSMDLLLYLHGIVRVFDFPRILWILHATEALSGGQVRLLSKDDKSARAFSTMQLGVFETRYTQKHVSFNGKHGDKLVDYIYIYMLPKHILNIVNTTYIYRDAYIYSYIYICVCVFNIGTYIEWPSWTVFKTPADWYGTTLALLGIVIHYESPPDGMTRFWTLVPTKVQCVDTQWQDVCMSMCVRVYLSIFLSCLSIEFIYLSIYLSTYLSIYLSIYLIICTYVCMYVRMYVCM